MKSNRKREYRHRLSKDEILTETAGLGIAGTGVIRCIMQNSSEVNDIMKNLKGNHKLQARAYSRLLEDPEIARTVVRVSNNNEFKRGVSNIDRTLLKKFANFGLLIGRSYLKKKVFDIAFYNVEAFMGEQDEMFEFFEGNLGNLETLENNLIDLFTIEMNFIENLLGTGSEYVGETLELLEDAGELTSEIIDFILGVVDFIE